MRICQDDDRTATMSANGLPAPRSRNNDAREYAPLGRSTARLSVSARRAPVARLTPALSAAAYELRPAATTPRGLHPGHFFFAYTLVTSQIIEKKKKTNDIFPTRFYTRTLDCPRQQLLPESG